MKTRLGFLALLLACMVPFATAQTSTVPAGTEIKVRTDTTIPATPPAGASYSASVSDDVPNTSGGVAIPKGSRARLVATKSPDGKDTVLDLRSVTVGSRRYNLVAGGGKSEGTGTLGANKRTAKYVGGGAVVGAVLGALLGGGKGAAIGAVLGGGAGAGAQVLTGKKKGIPAETQLTYKTAQELSLQSAYAPSNGSLKKRPASQK